MQPQNAVLNRINLNVFNWVHVIAIECDTEEKLTIHFDSGYSKTFTDKPVIHAIIDLIQIFPDIMHEPTRMKMKEISLMNNPMNMNTEKMKKDHIMNMTGSGQDAKLNQYLNDNPEAKERYEEAQKHMNRMKGMQSKGV